MPDQRIATNRSWWEERVAIHVASRLYDLDRFRAGQSSLRDYEPAELGGVRGLELLHLQCHIGNDSLSWARLGARVTGYDFSPAALRAARELAREVGLEARFVEGQVAEAADRLGRQFDVVYTGKGALTWLPQLGPWAEQLARLVRPRGLLYLVEFHPLNDVMGADPEFTGNYVDGEESVFDEPGDYAEPEALTESNRSHLWFHSLGEVVTEIARQGFHLELLRERCETYFQRFPAPFLEQREPGLWVWPRGRPQLPLSYSLLARRES